MVQKEERYKLDERHCLKLCAVRLYESPGTNDLPTWPVPQLLTRMSSKSSHTAAILVVTVIPITLRLASESESDSVTA